MAVVTRDNRPLTRPTNMVPMYVGSDLVFFSDPRTETHRRGMADTILSQHGLSFHQRPFDLSLAKPLKLKGRCYDQAMDTALERGLHYCEGFVISTADPRVFLGHGWCCTSGGFVVDPTLPHVQGTGRVVYLGVPIKLGYSLRWRAAFGYFGAMDGHPSLGPSVGIHADPTEDWLDTGVVLA